MTETIHATHAQLLIWIIAALIPLLIWAFRDAEQRLAARRDQLQRRVDR